ncbi:MAG: complex I NDUFA9 subunit family protein [Armatimonadetes bacterium]|nr:complex I NDUFA9 subunit family protein [Armatimonadota bacterium]
MILITGGTGFVGSHVVRALTEARLEVRCLARTPASIEGASVVVGDVTDPGSLADAVSGVETIVHLVGIIRERGRATFERVHVEGTRNVIEAAGARGVRRIIHMSALGARPDGVSRYETTKWQAEELVRASGMEWVVVRPSVIIGERGEFTGILRDLVTRPPVIPVIGTGTYRLQPLYVRDLARAFVRVQADGSLWGSVYEFGGPEQLTFNEMLRVTAEVLGVRKPMVHLPLWLMKPLIASMERLTARFPITSDQLAMMAGDSVTERNAFAESFEIEPTPFREALELSLKT